MSNMYSDESVSPYISYPAVSVIIMTDVAFHYTTDHIQLLGYRRSAFAKTNKVKQVTNCQLWSPIVFMTLRLRHICQLYATSFHGFLWASHLSLTNIMQMLLYQ
jgi:hypothetical protein